MRNLRAIGPQGCQRDVRCHMTVTAIIDKAVLSTRWNYRIFDPHSQSVDVQRHKCDKELVRKICVQSRTRLR